MKITRILIVGYGSMGHRHLCIARDLFPNSDIRVFRHKINSEIPDLSNGIISDDQAVCEFLPQIAVFANPATMRAKLGMMLISLGCHLLIEKPISHSTIEAQQMIAFAKKKNVTLLIGYNLRYTSALNTFKKILVDGSLGKIFSVRANVGQSLTMWRPKNYKLGVSSQKSLGGGVLTELSHEIDYLIWIFGKIQWVSCWLGRVSNLDLDVEDTAHLTFGFKNKYSERDFVCQLNMDFIRHDPIRLCSAIGEFGSVRWNGLDNEVAIWNCGDTEWSLVAHEAEGVPESYWLQWRYFIDCVSNLQSDVKSAEESLYVLKIIEAARISSKNNSIRFSVDDFKKV